MGQVNTHRYSLHLSYMASLMKDAALGAVYESVVSNEKLGAFLRHRVDPKNRGVTIINPTRRTRRENPPVDFRGKF